MSVYLNVSVLLTTINNIIIIKVYTFIVLCKFTLAWKKEKNKTKKENKKLKKTLEPNPSARSISVVKNFGTEPERSVYFGFGSKVFFLYLIFFFWFVFFSISKTPKYFIYFSFFNSKTPKIFFYFNQKLQKHFFVCVR